MSKGIYKVSTTYEFANDFVRALAGKLGDKKAKVTGAIISTRDLTGELNFKDKKQFMGVKQFIIDLEMSGKEILNICDKIPSSFIALSFKTDESELKIKAKAPKSAKPSSKGDSKIVPNFCRLVTKDKELAKDILFDVDIDNFNKAEISHMFIIKEIILPKNESDPSKIRELAKRKGKIIRKILVDGKESMKEKDFSA